MIKKLLNLIFALFSIETLTKNTSEIYLSQSSNLYDLKNRMRELDRKNVKYSFYI